MSAYAKVLVELLNSGYPVHGHESKILAEIRTNWPGLDQIEPDSSLETYMVETIVAEYMAKFDL